MLNRGFTKKGLKKLVEERVLENWFKLVFLTRKFEFAKTGFKQVQKKLVQTVIKNRVPKKKIGSKQLTNEKFSKNRFEKIGPNLFIKKRFGNINLKYQRKFDKMFSNCFKEKIRKNWSQTVFKEKVCENWSQTVYKEKVCKIGPKLF